MSRLRKDDGYRNLVEEARKAAPAGRLDWTAEEWLLLMERASSQKIEAPARRIIPSFRPAFAYTLAFFLVVAGAQLAVRRMARQAVPTGSVASLVQPAEGPLEIAPGLTVPVADAGLLAAARPSRSPSPIASASFASAGGPAAPPAKRDVPALTWVSPETGLKIVWFFNDQIKLED